VGTRTEATNLIPKHRYADVSLIVDARMVDLCRECNLCIAPEPSSRRSKDDLIALTVGALNGKFSGKVSVKWNVPPLYGLSLCVQDEDTELSCCDPEQCGTK
jgi:hypothetical protein